MRGRRREGHEERDALFHSATVSMYKRPSLHSLRDSSPLVAHSLVVEEQFPWTCVAPHSTPHDKPRCSFAVVLREVDAQPLEDLELEVDDSPRLPFSWITARSGLCLGHVDFAIHFGLVWVLDLVHRIIHMATHGFDTATTKHCSFRLGSTTSTLISSASALHRFPLARQHSRHWPTKARARPLKQLKRTRESEFTDGKERLPRRLMTNTTLPCVSWRLSRFLRPLRPTTAPLSR